MEQKQTNTKPTPEPTPGPTPEGRTLFAEIAFSHKGRRDVPQSAGLPEPDHAA